MLDVPLTKVTAPKETVKPWQSKTLWVALIVAVAPFFPPAQVLIATSPEIVSSVVGGLFAILRMISSDKVSLK